MKKVLGLAAAGLLAASAAQAGTLTVANTDMTLYGGISASYNFNSDRTDKDFFSVDTVAVGLMKKATEKSPVGFNAALAQFEVKTVHGKRVTGALADDAQLWLGYFSLMPAAGLTIDAGLLWQNFGEAPITILNKQTTRSLTFAFQPVAFGGARVSYSNAGLTVYAGYNDDSALAGGTHGDNGGTAAKNAIEAGVKYDAGIAKVGVNYWGSENGNDIINVCVGSKISNVNVKLEYNNIKSDTKATFDTVNSIIAYADLNLGNIELPIRFENISVKGGGNTNKANFITVSPTLHPTKNSYIRGEVAYGNGDAGLVNSIDTTKKNITTIIAEFGFLF